MEEKKLQVLELQIEVNEPTYDDEGQVIHKDDEGSSDEMPEYLDGIFNANLLTDEYMDAQPYEGEQDSNSDGSQEGALR